VTAAGTGQTQTPSEADTVNQTLTRLRTRQAELEAEDRSLSARAERLRNLLKTADPTRVNEDVRRLQRELQMAKDDGKLGPDTRRRIERELKSVESDRTRIGRDRDTASRDIERQDARARALERQGNRDAAEANMPWYDRFVRQYAGPLSMVAGAVGGAPFAFAGRRAAVRGTNAAMERRTLEMNALLDRRPNDISGRMAGVNRFYHEGGGVEPFRVSPRAAGGFTETGRRVADRTPASNLYPPLTTRETFVQPIDYGIVGGAVGVAGLAEIRLRQAQGELEDARRAAEANGSAENLERLRRAEARYDWTLLGARALQGAPLTYPVAAARYRYQGTRPDVQRAEAEVRRLSEWRRRQ
jgi:hypothetical protein